MAAVWLMKMGAVVILVIILLAWAIHNMKSCEVVEMEEQHFGGQLDAYEEEVKG